MFCPNTKKNLNQFVSMYMPKIIPLNLDQPIRPPLKVFWSHEPNLSECRDFAYSQDMRTMAVQNGLNGNDRDPVFVNLQQQGQYPHTITVNCFMERFNLVGNSRPYRRTGNIRSSRELERNEFNFNVFVS